MHPIPMIHGRLSHASVSWLWRVVLLDQFINEIVEMLAGEIPAVKFGVLPRRDFPKRLVADEAEREFHRMAICARFEDEFFDGVHVLNLVSAAGFSPASLEFVELLARH